MEAFGEHIFVVPVEPELLDEKPVESKFGVKSEKVKTYSFLWKVLSVGNGITYLHGEDIVRVPVPVSVGDIVLLKQCDAYYRDVLWVEHQSSLKGERGIYQKYDQILAIEGN
jgi:hypothetical protein